MDYSNEKVGTGLVNSSKKEWNQSNASSQYKRNRNLLKTNDFKDDESDCLSQTINQYEQNFGGFLDESLNSHHRPDEEQLSTNRMQKISDIAYEVDQAYEDYDDEEVCVPLQFEAF